MEGLIGHDERDAGFGVRGAFVDLGLVLYVDCPCCLDAILVLDLELEDRIGLESEGNPTRVSTNEPPPSVWMRGGGTDLLLLALLLFAAESLESIVELGEDMSGLLSIEVAVNGCGYDATRLAKIRPPDTTPRRESSPGNRLA